MCRNRSAASFRFPKSARLTRVSEFKSVKDGGVSYTGKYLVLGTLPGAHERATRVGLVTSRRVGPAVVRNRVRRRLREIYRLNQHRLLSGWWLVVIARRLAASASSRQLERDWLRLVERASILTPI